MDYNPLSLAIHRRIGQTLEMAYFDSKANRFVYARCVTCHKAFAEGYGKNNTAHVDGLRGVAKEISTFFKADIPLPPTSEIATSEIASGV